MGTLSRMWLVLALATGCSFDLSRTSLNDTGQRDAVLDLAALDAKLDGPGPVWDARKTDLPASDLLPKTDGPRPDGPKPDTAKDQLPQADTAAPCTGCVSTLAGSTAGFADGVGSAAKFDSPRGVALDGKLLYVADAKNHVIRSVDTTTGKVTRVAGQAGLAGMVEGDALNNARFQLPSDAAVVAGVVYVAEAGTNRRIRKITGGQVSTLLDEGQATVGLVSSGTTLYYSTIDCAVAPTDCHHVRSVSTAGGPSTWIAGGLQGLVEGLAGAARFWYVADLAVVSSDLYLADQNNDRIRKISGGTVSTFGPPSTLSSPAGIVYDPLQGRLLVADSNHHCIRALALPGGTLTTVAGACGSIGSADGGATTQARFSNPRGLALDGNVLYIVDQGNHRIRKLTL